MLETFFHTSSSWSTSSWTLASDSVFPAVLNRLWKESTTQNTADSFKTINSAKFSLSSRGPCDKRLLRQQTYDKNCTQKEFKIKSNVMEKKQTNSKTSSRRLYRSSFNPKAFCRGKSSYKRFTVHTDLHDVGRHLVFWKTNIRGSSLHPNTTPVQSLHPDGPRC